MKFGTSYLMLQAAYVKGSVADGSHSANDVGSCCLIGAAHFDPVWDSKLGLEPKHKVPISVPQPPYFCVLGHVPHTFGTMRKQPRGDVQSIKTTLKLSTTVFH